MDQINWVAVGVATVLQFGLGGLWYSPKVFGKIWMTSIGLTPDIAEEAKKKGMAKAMIICLISCFFLATSTVHFIGLVQATSIKSAIYQLICPVVGFILAPVAMGIEFEQRKWGYFWVTAGYLVVGMGIAAVAAVLL
ncbi:MAG: DUF1761 domain-containing protein [Candidatus Margulisiibacteriota bacterium]